MKQKINKSTKKNILPSTGKKLIEKIFGLNNFCLKCVQNKQKFQNISKQKNFTSKNNK